MLFTTLLLLCATGAMRAQSREALELNERGREAAARRDFTAAERDYRAAADLYRSLGAPFEAHVSIELFNLAEAICGEGRWREGSDVFREALELSRRGLGPKHIRTVATLNALGHVEMILGDFDSAAARFNETLALGRELYARDVQLAYALAGISSLKLRANLPDEALVFADEALQVVVAAEPKGGVDSALMYQNVGRIHRAAGRSERALPLLRKARALYEQAQATADPRYAATLSEEGLALMDEGKNVQADADLKRAIQLLEPCAGCAIELAVARNNLGLLRFRQKKYAEADELLRNALAAEELFNPSDAAQIGRTRNALQQVRCAVR